MKAVSDSSLKALSDSIFELANTLKYRYKSFAEVHHQSLLLIDVPGEVTIHLQLSNSVRSSSKLSQNQTGSFRLKMHDLLPEIYEKY